MKTNWTDKLVPKNDVHLSLDLKVSRILFTYSRTPDSTILTDLNLIKK